MKHENSEEESRIYRETWKRNQMFGFACSHTHIPFRIIDTMLYCSKDRRFKPPLAPTHDLNVIFDSQDGLNRGRTWPSRFTSFSLYTDWRRTPRNAIPKILGNPPLTSINLFFHPLFCWDKPYLICVSLLFLSFYIKLMQTFQVPYFAQ